MAGKGVETMIHVIDPFRCWGLRLGFQGLGEQKIPDTKPIVSCNWLL